jgi:hypothetical protein
MPNEAELEIRTLGRHVGRVYLLPVKDGDLLVPVKVEDVRKAYGYIQLRVTPDHDRGDGTTWVNLTTLQT